MKIIDCSSLEEFTNIITSTEKSYIVVDFWASFCGPCKQLLPKLTQLSEEYNDVEFIKVNIEKCSEIMEKYNVTKVPTFIIFERNNLQYNIPPIVGASNFDKIKEHLVMLTSNVNDLMEDDF